MKAEIELALQHIDKLCKEIEQVVAPFIRDNYDKEGNIIDQNYAQIAFGVLLISGRFNEAKTRLIEFIESDNHSGEQVLINSLKENNESMLNSLNTFKEYNFDSALKIQSSLNLAEQSIKANTEIIKLLASSLELETE